MDINTTQLLKNNLRVVAFDLKGKKPLGKWLQFKEKQTRKEFDEEIKKGNAFAIVCEPGLECIDVDTKYDEKGNLAFELFWKLEEAIEDFHKKVLINTTRSGGYHIIYRCEGITDGNMHLAFAKFHGTKKCIIETRGYGGIFVFPPSKGYSFYTPAFSTIDNFEIKTVTRADRDKMIQVCKGFNAIAEEVFKKSKKKSIPQEIAISNNSTISDFNSKVCVTDLLRELGHSYAYTKGDSDYWIRSGKQLRDGISMVVSSYQNKMQVWNWSPNTYGVKVEEQQDAFDLYAHMHHGDDYKAAVKDLYKQGYGDRIKSVQEQNKEDIALITSDSKDKDKALNNEKLEQIFLKSRITLENKPPDIQYNFFIKDNMDNVHSIASYGDLITITGFAGSGKTTLTNEIIKSTISKGYCLDGKVLLKMGSKNIIHLDTEQSEQDCYIDFEKVMNSVGIKKTPINYFKFSIGGYTVKERLAFVEYVINRVGHVGMLLLDGIVDICTNYNDLEISQALMEHIRHLGIKKKFITFSILHNAKTTGLARGHLGTESDNKSKAMFETVKEKDDSGFTGRYLIKHIKQRGGKSIDQISYEFDGNGNIISEKF